MKKGKKIEVAVRMRPLIYEYEDSEAWDISEQGSRVSSLPHAQALKHNSSMLGEEGPRRKSKVEQNNIYEFSCDYAFPSAHSNLHIYSRCCRQVVQEFLTGQHATIFMYGQTTSGKTYTMLGSGQTEGVIIYSLKDIFQRQGGAGQLKISYLEIYNEQINDLLVEGSTNLKIADQNVVGLSSFNVSNIAEALQLLQEGEYQRAYAQKRHHDHSSRSHTIFQIKMMEGERVKAVLNLVDLSGSERLSEEDGNEETGYINKSLFVLSNVIHKLSLPKKNAHIPFRDSKLTRLLAPSLTTSKKTLIICTISPAEINFSQTLSTLRFAAQSRRIELRGLDESLNESIDTTNKKKISQLIEENSLLKKNLSFAQDKENDDRVIEGKIKRIQELIDQGSLPVSPYGRQPRSVRVNHWRTKAETLCQQYQKNVSILQKEYLKAIVNLTSSELNLDKNNIKSVLDLTATLD